MVKDSNDFEGQDTLAKERLKARKEFKTYIYDVRTMIEE